MLFHTVFYKEVLYFLIGIDFTGSGCITYLFFRYRNRMMLWISALPFIDK